MARKGSGVPGFLGWLILLAVMAGPITAGLAAFWDTLFGKSYAFPGVEIDTTVLPDGSLSLVERRTFDTAASTTVGSSSSSSGIGSFSSGGGGGGGFSGGGGGGGGGTGGGAG